MVGKETLALDWFTPNEALDAFHKGTIKFITPQFVNLTELSRMSFADIDAFVKKGVERPGIRAITPEYEFLMLVRLDLT